jgi:N-acetylneuraminic acid mutarotase
VQKIVLLFIAVLTVSCLAVNSAHAANSDAWETKASMNVARSSLGAAVLNGEIYAIGGVIDPPSYVTCTGANEKYDPISNQWTTKTAMPTARASFATAVVNGKIYCIGGTTGLKDGQTIVSGITEVYDPKTDSWETKTDLPTPRVGVTAGVVNDQIYVVGGDSNATEVYDPKRDTWTSKAAMPFKPGLRMIWSCTSTVVDGKIHVFGAFPYSVSHQVYDPIADSWTVEAPIVQGYLLASAAATGSGDIWVFGVDSTWWDAGPPDFTSLTYDSAFACWRVSSLMPTPRVNAALATVGDSIYVIGGSIVMIENNAHPTTIVEKYTPQNDCQVEVQPPKIEILLPQDKTFSTTFAVDFTLNKPVVNIKLGVDGQPLVQISGNTSLTLQPGKHTLTVYAVDFSGHIGYSKTVTFNVYEVQPFPVLLVGVVSVFLVAVALLLVYFGKRLSH